MPARRISWTRTDTAFLGLFTLAVLVIFRQVLFNPDVVLFGVDVLDQHYMFEKFVRESLVAGRLPFWNPYLFSGMPALSHPQYLVLYPGQMALRWLPLNLAISWTQAVHVWLGGAGMYLLCRKIELKSWIAFACALLFILNSGIVLRIHAGHVWLVYALCWFPWAWLFCMIALESGRWWAIVGGAIVICLVILTGHPTVPAYIFLFLGFYWLFTLIMAGVRRRTGRELLRITGRFVLMFGLGAGLSAFQVLPSLVMQREISLAAGYNPEIANFLALRPVDMINFIIPGVYATPERQLFFWEGVPYLGVLFLLVLPFAFSTRSRRPFLLFLLFVGGFSFLMALGEAAGVYPFLQKYVPIFRILRIPTRALVLWIPAVILIGGIGLQKLSNQEVPRTWFRVLSAIYMVLALLIALFWLGMRLNLSKMAALAPEQFSADLALGVPLLLILILIAVFLFRNLHLYGHTLFAIVPVILILGLDPGIFSAGHILPATPPLYGENERLLLPADTVPDNERVLSPAPTNVYMLGEVNHIYGYNSGNLGRYEQFLGATAGTISGDFLPELDRRKIAFLGASYLFTTWEMDADLVDVFSSGTEPEEKTIYLYHNADVLPRAYVPGEMHLVTDREEAQAVISAAGFDYRQSVVIEADADHPALSTLTGQTGEGDVTITGFVPWSGRVAMQVTMTRPGILVLSEPYYPERKFLVNGVVTPALAANLAFSAVPLPAGEHEVILFYDPVSFRIGLGISTLFVILIAIFIVMKIRRQRRKRLFLPAIS